MFVIHPTCNVIIDALSFRRVNNKVAAQCCHGALGAVRSQDNRGGAVSLWESRGEATIVLQCDGLSRLKTLRDAAVESGLPTFTVTDAGRTEVSPGEITVLAIGPASNERIDAITGHLRLLR